MSIIPNLTTGLQLPFKISITSNLTNNTFTLNINIELEAVRDVLYPLHDLNVKVFFPDGYQNSNLSVNLGDLEFSQKSQKENNANSLTWGINRLDKNISASLKGNLIVDNINNSSSSSVMIFSCKIDKFSISGGSVTKGTINKNPKNSDISKKGRNFTFIKNLEIVF